MFLILQRSLTYLPECGYRDETTGTSMHCAASLQDILTESRKSNGRILKDLDLPMGGLETAPPPNWK